MTELHKLMNYMNNDCLIDYLEIKNRRKSLRQNKQDKKPYKSSMDYIQNNNKTFKDYIYNIIKKEIPNYKILTKNESSKEIIESKKHDIIFNSILQDIETSVISKIDILIKFKCLKKIIKNKELFNENNLSDNDYVILNIIPISIELNNTNSISNNSNLLYHKTRMHTNLNALNNITNTHNTIAYGICKKYYKKDKNYNSFDDLCVYKLPTSCELNNKLIDGINWLNKLEKEWYTYCVYPINNNNLYPNMKNTIYDEQYKEEKEEIAKYNKEITLLWNCGIKNRSLAFNYNIKKYNDKELNATRLGFDISSKKYITINKILSINRDTNTNLIDIPKENNTLNWRKQEKYEFYVDFETFNTEQELMENQTLYMIGVYYKNKYIVFLLKYKNIKIENIKENVKVIECESEQDLVKNFIKFIEKKTKNNNYRLIHWSDAEPIIFNKKLKLYNIVWNNNWYDLLKVYKNEDYPIVIKDCFNYGLKSVIKSLHNHKLLDIQWDELDSGLLSSFIAQDIYEYQTHVNNNKHMCELIEYNKIDCVVMCKLLEFMRQ